MSHSHDELLAAPRRLAALGLSLLVFASIAGAQTFSVSWWTIDGGGNDALGGVFQLSGTLGQPDAGAMSGGQFTLYGGYWSGAPSRALGDLNCDGKADFRDINPFVLLLSDPAAWQAVYPGCPAANGDCNRDGNVDFKDINPFVAVLSGG
jgi:hypothetical protein